MRKYWPWIGGVLVLIVGVTVSGRLSGAKPGVSTSDVPRLHAGLQPLKIEAAPQALYYLVSESLVEKLKTGDLLLTVREYRELTRQTTSHLLTDLGLELPAGFYLPPEIPADWLKHPGTDSTEDLGRLRKLYDANRQYLQNVVRRLLDEHASETVQLVTDRLSAICSFRLPADRESLDLVKSVYGEHFVTEFVVAHAPGAAAMKTPERNRSRKQKPAGMVLPAKQIAAAEAQIASLWRTEFQPAELPKLRDYISIYELQDKLREDLLHGVLSAGERELMEKDAFGSRLIFLHNLTRKALAGHSTYP